MEVSVFYYNSIIIVLLQISTPSLTLFLPFEPIALIL